MAFTEVIFEKNQEIFGNWVKENNPYLINGKVTIPKGKTLTIERGVIIKLRTGSYNNYMDINFDLGFINVEGNIIVNGTKNEPVLFTRNGNRGYWGIIFINSQNPNNLFNYSIIEYGNKIENININSEDNRGVISLYESMCNFNNCIFRNNNCFGILQVSKANCIISYCTFFNNGTGIVKWFDSYISIENSIIWENGSSFWDYGTFDVDSLKTKSTIMVKNSIIQYSDEELSRLFMDMGGNKFNVNPLFDNESCINLKFNSPCKGMSTDKKTIGAFQN
jgi:hypothetical protein